jgi:phosphoglycolate phosphatase
MDEAGPCPAFFREGTIAPLRPIPRISSVPTANPPAPDLQAAIVDLDGTMVDTLGDFNAAVNAALSELRLPGMEGAAIAALVGRGTEHLLRSVLAHVEAPEMYEAAWDAYHRHYRAINGRYSAVYPGAVQGLQLLQQAGLRLACLTNKPTAFARDLVAMKDLQRFFAVVIGGDAFERKKPDPLPLLKTCEALGSTPARTLVIGDSSNDARAARAAGCPVLLVTYGYNHGEPVRAVDADGFLDSLADLSAWLRPAVPTARP